MNRGLSCNIHKNYPIFHINLLEKEKAKLQCVKCISNKRIEVEFLLLQDIIEFDSNSFFENWPPLSNESLRDNIIKLKNNDTDINQPIEEFYESLTQEIIQIISQKKKEQLIQAQKVYELKSDIIEQYQQMAQIDKMKEFLVQENQQTEKIEQDLKEHINSQFQKKDEYTSQLSCMMKQYELISKLDDVRTAQLKANILEILKVVNLLPQNNFNFGTEKAEFRFENIEAYKKKIEEELQINKQDQIKIQILIDQLNLCKNELIQRMNQKDWFLDNFLKEQQTLLLNNQLNQAQFMKDIYKNTIDLQNLMTNQIQQLGQTNFKYFSEFNYNLKLKNDDIFIFSNYRQNQSIIDLTQDEKNLTLEFRVCLKDNLIQYKNSDKRYYFGVQFFSDNVGDMFDIIKLEELNEFPDN
ncbi:hypothetical protein TTHERM_00904000 (macronuclear) [Tetrahymena thermophila SB210]|uniref:Zinc carboxypeptidase family protein n=1 Tax=Tetrahymena thermophila (strain SB210) TaxID=312017 RepID=Q24G97_TETTS|nr:hypothetical protein TTHERM_00904000 [Tetrahymena thermophila SB210]EAS06833.2 hypothetical protein TTHERM_00904000 [Tetrahymena thermophila SB210]|eukprot:XP_001027075.2 hypothetical protein TTHERM_00904000 [Tetrahymena thermophila SB210]